jgi:hypothetical protein
LSIDGASFLSCLATILELPATALPELSDDADPTADLTLQGWLGAREIGIVPVADAKEFAWPGPWIARVRSRERGERRAVVMYGRSPSGVVWDPAGGGEVDPSEIEDGFVLAAEDIALALPTRAEPSAADGAVEELWLAGSAGEPGRSLEAAMVTPGEGLEGDRYPAGRGTFASPRPGSALTLIEAEVCESFEPPLRADEHRRNVVTRGIRLNGLVGREFAIGRVRCVGVRLCEPCATLERYTQRTILRPLVHRGGLRADVLDRDEIRVGDPIAVRR